MCPQLDPFPHLRPNPLQFMGAPEMAIGFLSHVVWSLMALGGGLLLLIYLVQDKMIYVPDIEMSRLVFLEPKEYGLEEVWEEVFVDTPDGEKIQVWFFKADNHEHAPTMLYFHGNAGNISHRLHHIRSLVKRVNVNVLIVSYRGYGKSTGAPSESGLKIDAQAAFDYLKRRPDIDKKKIVVFGSSLGGAVAIDLVLSNQDEIFAVALENTFTCIPDMVDSVLPALKYFKFLVTNPWHSLTKIKSIHKVPVLFLSGKRDELVPEWMMIRLYDACAAGFKKFVSFPEGQHVNTFLAAGYYPELRQFLDEVAKRHSHIQAHHEPGIISTTQSHMH